MFAKLILEGLDMRYTGKGDANFLETLNKLITILPSNSHDSMKALLRDLVSTNPNEGRVSKAFSTPERV